MDVLAWTLLLFCMSVSSYDELPSLLTDLPSGVLCTDVDCVTLHHAREACNIALTRAGSCNLQVSYIEFSPDEKCLLSFSTREPTNPQEKAAMQVNIFDAQTGAKLRKFEGSVEEFAVGSAAMGDGSPIFKWAASGCALSPCRVHPHPSPPPPSRSTSPAVPDRKLHLPSIGDGAPQVWLGDNSGEGPSTAHGHPGQVDCDPGVAVCLCDQSVRCAGRREVVHAERPD